MDRPHTEETGDYIEATHDSTAYKEPFGVLPHPKDPYPSDEQEYVG